MAYRFRKSEALPHAIKRVFVEEIDWAVGQLSNSKNRAKAVHEARKSLKKIRSLLSVVQTQLGPLYKSEDRYFRDAGRQLSGLRDTQVMLELFDKMADKDAEAPVNVRHTLERSTRETPDENRVSGNVVRQLTAARPKPDRLPLADLSFESLVPNLVATYRRGRKALKRAEKSGTAEDLHELRKTVKQHWFHLRLLESGWDAATKERAKSLRELETWLGDGHNLHVLHQRIGDDVETARDRHQVKHFMALLENEQQELRTKALASAQRLYSIKPRDLGEQLRKLWGAIPRKGPASAPGKARSAVA